ncbi:phage holin family protein [Polaromonas sp. CG_23.6]|uniref:phage holin family protein n=1 Tax=Polaromonas sp. CG_23.6 TaxID=2760709 RepID=UPI002473FB34|nr:phage holin family protein [Polaromonas sp. CG_23.6]MDH6185472.1 sugar phosphate permease [Polaromonas sp. CG_23.6]
MRLFISILLCAHLLIPVTVWAEVIVKTPLSYSLQEYGIVLATALLGGLASWWMKVRRGELLAWNLSALIGELCVSAFAGLVAFWLCEYSNFNPLLTSAIVGMSGHAGVKALTWIETVGQRIIEKRLGIEQSKETR